MTDRIKISLEKLTDVAKFLLHYDNNLTKEETEKLTQTIKQILEDQEKAEYYGKWVDEDDPNYNGIFASIAQENKQLKKDLEHEVYRYDTLTLENIRLREQVERELKDNNELRKTTMKYFKLKPMLEECIINLEGLKIKVAEWKNELFARKMSFGRLDYMIRWSEKLKEILKD